MIDGRTTEIRLEKRLISEKHIEVMEVAAVKNDSKPFHQTDWPCASGALLCDETEQNIRCCRESIFSY